LKFVAPHNFADPNAAARKLIEIANGIEAVQDGRILIERVNEPFLAAGGSTEQFRAGIERAIALLADPKDIKQYGPIMPEPDNAHNGGPTGDTDDYLSHEVQQMAHHLALNAISGST
jgi:hypothetical protein